MCPGTRSTCPGHALMSSPVMYATCAMPLALLTHSHVLMAFQFSVVSTRILCACFNGILTCILRICVPRSASSFEILHASICLTSLTICLCHHLIATIFHWSDSYLVQSFRDHSGYELSQWAHTQNDFWSLSLPWLWSLLMMAWLCQFCTFFVRLWAFWLLTGS